MKPARARFAGFVSLAAFLALPDAAAGRPEAAQPPPRSAQPDSRFPALMALGQEALAARDYAGAQEALTKAVALRPADVAARYALARAYGEDKKYQPAVRHLEETLRLSPGHQPALCDLAAIEENSGRFERAAELYERALKSGPSPRADRGLASMLALQGRTDEAIARLRKLSSASPSDLETRYALAQALTQAGDCAGAVAPFEAILAKDPVHQGALFNLGNCLNRLGRSAEAAAMHERFAKASREEAERIDRGRRVYFLLLEADRRMERGDLPGAIAAADEAATVAPGDARPHAVRAQALDARGDSRGALAAYQRSAELDPRNAIVLVEVGRLLGQGGRFTEALPWLERAARSDPTLPEPHLMMAAVFQQLGRTAEAAAAEATYRRLAAARGDR